MKIALPTFKKHTISVKKIVISIVLMALIFSCGQPPNISTLNTITKIDTANIKQDQMQNANSSVENETFFDLENMDNIDVSETVISVVLNEIEIIDTNFNSQVECILKKEKKCGESKLRELHWLLVQTDKNLFELSASPYFEGEYFGYCRIDSSIVLLQPHLSDIYLQTPRKKKIKFIKCAIEVPNDCSNWNFILKDKTLNLNNPFLIGCD